MTKDPAFLFYYQDFAYGTRRMTFEEKGAYIELLCEQADSGHLSLHNIKRILNSHFAIWDTICSKFIQDENGNYYNKVLDEHLSKRRKYTESRRNNLKSKDSKQHMGVHMDEHMVNVNTNVNVNKEERIYESSNEPTIDEVKQFFSSMGYPTKDAENFYSYYSAQGWETTSGMSIKKTWNKKVIGWMNNQKQFTKYPQQDNSQLTDRYKKDTADIKQKLKDNETKLKQQGAYKPSDDPEFKKLLKKF